MNTTDFLTLSLQSCISVANEMILIRERRITAIIDLLNGNNYSLCLVLPKIRSLRSARVVLCRYFIPSLRAFNPHTTFTKDSLGNIESNDQCESWFGETSSAELIGKMVKSQTH